MAEAVNSAHDKPRYAALTAQSQQKQTHSTICHNHANKKQQTITNSRILTEEASTPKPKK